ncbi:unnamed protein product [Sphenostylis stenocarpa]|uniref:Uncharacterized protein n=1 Tax=Sphenostylis stenocarpa TaxID=92480 RepID=A0AA86SAR2_9FABA|nr:unnamed protein product [Sphenostylis stenocarpa]
MWRRDSEGAANRGVRCSGGDAAWWLQWFGVRVRGVRRSEEMECTVTDGVVGAVVVRVKEEVRVVMRGGSQCLFGEETWLRRRD